MEKKYGRKTWRRSFTNAKTCSREETKYIHEVMDYPIRVYDMDKQCFIWVPLLYYDVSNCSMFTVNYNGRYAMCLLAHIPSGQPVCTVRHCSSCTEGEDTVCRGLFDENGYEYNPRECALTIYHIGGKI